jgi:hypothetical protein
VSLVDRVKSAAKDANPLENSQNSLLISAQKIPGAQPIIASEHITSSDRFYTVHK